MATVNVSFVNVVFIDFHSDVGSMTCHSSGVPTLIGHRETGDVGLPAIVHRAGGRVESQFERRQGGVAQVLVEDRRQFRPVRSLKKRTMSSVMMLRYLNVS